MTLLEKDITKELTNILKNKNKKKSFIREILKLEELEDDAIEKLEVIEEYSTGIELLKDLGSKKIDIVLKSDKYFIPIEVKLYADDHVGQLDSYYDEMKRFYRDRGIENCKVNKVYYLSPGEKKPVNIKESCNIEIRNLLDNKFIKLFDVEGKINKELKEYKENYNEIHGKIISKEEKEFKYFQKNSLRDISEEIIEILNNIKKENMKKIGIYRNMSYLLKENYDNKNINIYLSLEQDKHDPYWGILINSKKDIDFDKKIILEKIKKYIENTKNDFTVSNIPWNGNWVFYKYIDKKAFGNNITYRNNVISEINSIINCFEEK